MKLFDTKNISIMKTKQEYTKQIAELRAQLLIARAAGDTELAGNIGLQIIKLTAEAIRASKAVQ